MADQWQPEPGPAQFKRLSAEQQDGILGRAAGAAYRAGALRLEDVVGRSYSPDWGSMIRVKSLRELVGAERQREFARWATALTRGDEAILRAAYEIAQQHGVLADYAGYEQIAELVTEGILRLQHDGWLPRQISVDATWFPSTDWKSTIASFDARVNSLLINPRQEYWRYSVAERQGQVSFWREEKYLSTASPLHPVLHEFGHSAWAHSAPDLYRKFRGELDAQHVPTARKVSDRALDSGSEFVAEVFAGIITGITYSDDVRALYRLFGGPLP